MIAKLMNGKEHEVENLLKLVREPANRIEHLLKYRNQLRITQIQLETPDGERYLLPMEFVYIFKPKNKDEKNSRSSRH